MMHFKNLLLVFACLAASVASNAHAQVPQPHDPLIVLISPSISQQDRVDFLNLMEHYCLEKLQPGDRIVIYDGSTLRPVNSLQISAQAHNPRMKMKACVPFWNSIAEFLKPSDDKHQIKVPQFLAAVMEVFPRSKPRILLVGSPIYNDESGKYDMSKGWLSDGYLNAPPSDSIFSISGKNNQLAGAKIYYAYLSDDLFDKTNDKEKHKSKVQAFWGKYIDGNSATLNAFLPNLKDVFPLWVEGVGTDLEHEPLDPSDKIMVINTPSVWTNPVTLPSDVLFTSGSAQLKPEAGNSLMKLGNDMKADKTMRFKIDGYTDSHGSTAMNQKLSLQRADAVKAWLVTQGGIDPSKIETAGLGKSNPLVPPGSSEQEARNRRVVITPLK